MGSRFKVDWTLPQVCSSCTVPMLKSGSLVQAGFVVHRRNLTCHGCVNAQILAEKPPELRRYVPLTVGDKRQCKRCLELLNLDMFYPSNTKKDGYSNDCKECDGFGRYGMSKKSYYELLEKQGYRCAICNDHVDTLPRKLYIDHDHKCCSGGYGSCGKCNRGLLCIKCNSGIGMLKDSEEVLTRALEYLKTNDRKTTNG